MSIGETQRTRVRESVRVEGRTLVEKVKELIQEGNVRRVIVKNDAGHTVMEVPVTAGVVVFIAAPVVSAVGALAALASHWSIEVERTSKPAGSAD